MQLWRCTAAGQLPTMCVLCSCILLLEAVLNSFVQAVALYVLQQRAEEFRQYPDSPPAAAAVNTAVAAALNTAAAAAAPAVTTAAAANAAACILSSLLRIAVATAAAAVAAGGFGISCTF